MPSPDSREVDLALAQLDTLGADETLRARAAAFAAEQKSEPADRYDGSEPTKSVWVTVDPRGRLVGVDISRTWRDRLEPEKFADALFGAYQAAMHKALAAEFAAGHVTAGQPEGEPPVRGDDYGAMPAAEWLAVARARLRRIDTRLRELSEETATRPDAIEVRSPNGYLTLQVAGRGVVGVTGNAGALKFANPDLLRQDVLDAFRRAKLAAER